VTAIINPPITRDPPNNIRVRKLYKLMAQHVFPLTVIYPKKPLTIPTLLKAIIPQNMAYFTVSTFSDPPL
jgi:hypothetical protein